MRNGHNLEPHRRGASLSLSTSQSEGLVDWKWLGQLRDCGMTKHTSHTAAANRPINQSDMRRTMSLPRGAH